MVSSNGPEVIKSRTMPRGEFAVGTVWVKPKDEEQDDE